jgi:integrase
MKRDKRQRIEESIYRRGDHLEVIVFATTARGRRQLYERMPGLNIRPARAARARLRAEAAAGTVPTDGSTRFRDHVEAWLEHRRRIRKIRPRTEARYRELLEEVWSIIGDPKLKSVDADTLQAVVDDLAARGVDPTQTFAVLRASLRYAVKKRRITYNPADGVELPERGGKELAIPSNVDLARALAAAGEPTEPFRMALTLAAALGLRRSEVVGLRREDLDLGARVVHVRRGVHQVRRPGGGTDLIEHAPKSARSTRTVEIPPSVIPLLREYLDAQNDRRREAREAWAMGWPVDDVLIDDGLGRPLRPDTLSARWRKLRAAIGIRREVRLHDFRALFVTESLAAGVDAGVVSRQVGHARTDFTRDVYQRARREDARAVAEAIDAALASSFRARSVDSALTGTDDTVVPIRRKRR